MKISSLKSLCYGAALVLASASQVPAASQSDLAASIGETRQETTITRNQLQSTVDALTSLTQQKKGDLRDTYRLFCLEVTNTQQAATSTAARAKNMVAASRNYFEGWQADVLGISNEELRKKAQKRLDAARKSYNQVAADLQQAAEKFKPFLSNLEDVQKTLANDITPGGVKAVRGTVSDANSNLKKVRSLIFEALEQLATMEKALSSDTGR